MTRIEEIEKMEKEIRKILKEKDSKWDFNKDYNEYLEYLEKETDELDSLSREKRMLMEPEFEIYNKRNGDLFTMEHFIENCERGCFIDYDGHGDYAKEMDGKMMVSDIGICPSDIENNEYRKDFTHVVWYNK